MLTNLLFIVSVTLVIFLFRVLFDAVVLHKRLRLSLNKKLVKVSLFTNSVALLVISIISLPLIDHSWAIFIIQILFVMGVEAPIYQIFFRKKSWYEVCLSLLLARFAFALIAMVIGILIMQFVAL